MVCVRLILAFLATACLQAPAAATPLADSLYKVPAGTTAAEQTPRHGADRAIGTRVSLVLADHRSRCASDRPTMYWYASGGVARVEHQIFELPTPEPVLRHVVVDTTEEGFFPLAFAELGLTLRPGSTYLWKAVVYPEGGGSHPTVVQGEFSHTPLNREQTERLAAAHADEHPALLGAASAWCELFHALTERIATWPDDEARWRHHRARMLRQVGLVDAARADEAHLPLEVFLRTGSQAYRSGERIELGFGASRRFHARLIYQDASGQRIQLLPNARRSDNVFEGNTLYTYPDGPDTPLVVSAPYGRERIVLQAAGSALAPLPGRPLPNGLILLDDDARSPAEAEPEVVERTVSITTRPAQ